MNPENIRLVKELKPVFGTAIGELLKKQGKQKICIKGKESTELSEDFQGPLEDFKETSLKNADTLVLVQPELEITIAENMGGKVYYDGDEKTAKKHVKEDQLPKGKTRIPTGLMKLLEKGPDECLLVQFGRPDELKKALPHMGYKVDYLKIDRAFKRIKTGKMPVLHCLKPFNGCPHPFKQETAFEIVKDVTKDNKVIPYHRALDEIDENEKEFLKSFSVKFRSMFSKWSPYMNELKRAGEKMKKDEDLVYSILEVLEIPHKEIEREIWEKTKELEKIPASPEIYEVSIKKKI